MPHFYERVARAAWPPLAFPGPRGLAAFAGLAAIVGALQLAAPEPAAAAPGLRLVQRDSEATGDEPSKDVAAPCPPDKLVVGGGAEVLDGAHTDVRLRSVFPDQQGTSFIATAKSAGLSQGHAWTLRVYAICANASSLRDYVIRRGSSGDEVGEFKQAAAVCPSGTAAYGAGASTIGNVPSLGQGWLQLIRTGGTLSFPDISRATARSAPGFRGAWHINSFAICARSQDGLHAHGTVAPGAQASDRCPAGFFTHGPGGGGGLIDGGPVWLDKIKPHPDLRGVDVSLTGPLHPSIGGMVAHQTCAH